MRHFNPLVRAHERLKIGIVRGEGLSFIESHRDADVVSGGSTRRFGMQCQYESGQGSWKFLAIVANEQLLSAYCNLNHAVDVVSGGKMLIVDVEQNEQVNVVGHWVNNRKAS